MGNAFNKVIPKAIPAARDRLQSRTLVAVMGALLVAAMLFLLTVASGGGLAARALLLQAVAISVLFAALVWRLRAGTPAAATIGALICLLLVFSGRLDGGATALHTGLSPLIALFVLTFAATRTRRGQKAKAGLAESRKGRNAAQVVANLGAAGLVAAFALAGQGHGIASTLLLAALAEATADTVSSEIGQAFGGPPILLTTLRRVEAGTDGAITSLGTTAGIAGAALVALTGQWALHLHWQQTLIALAAGTAGLFFDSLLGATVERLCWLGNDVVNFASTLFAVACALLLLAGTLHR